MVVLCMLDGQFPNSQAMLVDDVVLQFCYTFEGAFGAFASRISMSRTFEYRLALTVAMDPDFHENAFFGYFASASHYRAILPCSVFVDILEELSVGSILIKEFRRWKELHIEVVGEANGREYLIGRSDCLNMYSGLGWCTNIGYHDETMMCRAVQPS